MFAAGAPRGGGGGGGGGGHGYYQAATPGLTSLDVSGQLYGGNGGAGGNQTSLGTAGQGGDGGYGIYSDASGLTLTISATAEIVGGDGGLGGVNRADERASGGTGGAGVGGTDLTIINSGSISGGLSADGTRGNAVTFGAGDNVYEHRAGGSVTGAVVGDGDDLFRLGGDADGSFDAGSYRGFGSFEKTGTSVFTLTGTTTEVTPWTISAGTLAISSDAALGDTSGVLTLRQAGGDQPTLRADADLTMARDIAVYGNGKLDTNDHTVTFTGSLIGDGVLSHQDSSGPLILSGTSSDFTGELQVRGATLRIENSAALDRGSLDLIAGTLDYADGVDLGNSIRIASRGYLNQTGGSATQGGNIYGGGLLVKRGSGNLILSGANSYKSGTRIDEGSLTLANDLAASTGRIVTEAGTALFYADGVDIANRVELRGDTTLGQTGGSATQSGEISGSGSLTKTGSGNLTLAVSNTYTGGTTLAEGMLTVVENGSLGTGDLIAADGTALMIANGSRNIANNITLNGMLTTRSGGTNTLSGVITGTGSLLQAQNTLVLTNNANDYSGGTIITNGSGIRAEADGVFGSGEIRFAGGLSGYAPNGSLAYADGLTIANTLTIDTNTFAYLGVASGSVTQSGDITGTGSIAKNGGGTLRLTGNNTYTGQTQIRAGTLFIADEDALGSGALSFNPGTTLSIGAAASFANIVNLYGTGGRTFDIGSGDVTLSGIIQYQGALVKTGASRLTLTDSRNGYSGGTSLLAGSLGIGASSVLGSGTLSAANGTSLFYAGNTLTKNDIAFTGAAGGSVTFDVATGVATQSGTISGAATLAKTGGGTLMLTGANTYTGGTTLATGGTLGIGNSDALGTGTLTASDLTTIDYADGVNVGNAITISSTTLNQTGGSATQSGVISGTGSLTKTGSGSLTLSGANSFDGLVTLVEGTLVLANNLALSTGSLGTYDGTTVGFADGVTIGNTIDLFGTTTFNQTGGSATLSGLVRAGAFTKTGAGNLTLSGNNSYSGVATVSEGTLTVGHNSALGTTDGGTIVQDGATLAFADGFTTGEAITISGSGVNGAGALRALRNLATLTQQVTLAGASTIATDGAIFDLQGGIAGNFDLTLNSGTGGIAISSGLDIGDGSLTVEGSGTVSLQQTNSFTGDVTVNGGTLLLGTGTSTIADTIGDMARVTVNANGTLDLAQGSEAIGSLAGSGIVRSSFGGTLVVGGDNSSTTFSGALGDGTNGVLSLTKTGTGNLTLSGTSNNTGTITIAEGTLTVASQNALGALAGGMIVQDGATLALTTNLGLGAAFTIAGAGVSGTGALHNVSGYTTSSGEITLASASTISADSGSTLNLWGRIAGGHDLTLQGGGRIRLRGGLAIGDGTLTINGASVDLESGNSFTGDVVMNSGLLEIDALGASTIDDQARLTVNGGEVVLSQNETIGSLSGTGGTIRATGTRALTVGGDNTSTSFAGTVGGSLGLTKTGTGALTLSGTNTYTGATNVLAGTLYVNGDQSAATGLTSVAGGATLAGNGTIGGDVTLADGAVLAPGTSPGTLTINGDLALSDGTILNFQFGEAGVAGGALNDLVNVGGDLTLDGTLNVTTSVGGSFGAGVYRVFNYSGSLTDNGLALGTMPSSDVYLQTSVANQINLVNATGVALSFWDGAGAQNNGAVDGGKGIWQSGAGNTNWTDANGAVNGTYDDGTFAIFQGTGGTVSVDTSLGAVTASGLQFVTNGYIIDGDTLTLAGGSEAAIRVGDGTAGGAGITATIAADITGTVQLIKTDLGTLVLSGDNSYTGGTRLDAGTLMLGSDNALGTGALATSADTTLGLADGVSIANAIALGGDTTIDLSGASTLWGVISGSGALIRTGNATLVLTGANTYSGGTVLSGFTTITNSSALGTGTITGGGVLTIGADGIVLANDIDVQNVLNVSSTDHTVTLGGTISGAGNLGLSGTGTFILAGANTYAGGTFLVSGTARLANDAALGTGRLTLGMGTTVDYSDGVTIANEIRSSNPFVLNQTGGSATHSGVITGATSLTKTGSGNLTLSGANTYSRTTTVAEGTLTIGSMNALGSTGGGTIVQDGATLVLATSVTSENISIAGSGVDGRGALTGNGVLNGTVTLAGAAAIGSVSGGGLSLTQAIAGSDTDLVFYGPGATTISGGIATGAGGVTIDAGTGSVAFYAGNSFTGDLTLTSGTLEINASDASTIGDTARIVGTGGSINLAQNETVGSIAGSGFTIAGAFRGQTLTTGGDNTSTAFSGRLIDALGGTLALTKVGSGTFTLTGDNGFSGGTTLSGGALVLGSDNALGTGLLAAADGTAIGFIGDRTIGNAMTLDGAVTFATGTNDETLTGTISGAGDLTTTGTGSLTLTGANAYTGATNVQSGTLYVNGDQSGATGLTSVAGGATLAGNGTIGGSVTMADGASLNPGTSPGTLTINGDLALSGGTILNFQFGEAGVAGGALNDLVNVGGDLTLDGTLNVTTSVGGGFGAGVYRVFNYSGSLTDNGLALGTMPGGDVFVQTSVANQVNLVNAAGATFSFWDGATGANNDTIDGGNGTWQSSAGDTNWTGANGAVNGAYDDGTFAIFQGTGGTVTIDTSLGAVTSSGLQFVTDGYVVDGDTLTLAGGSEAAIRVGDGTAGGAGITATITADITGAVQLIKTDLGTLVLSGDNSYTGGTRLDAGTLVLGSDTALGTGALATSADTTLGLIDGVSIANVIALGGDTTIDLAGSSTLSGVISGSGALIRTGDGTLTLTGANTYTGATAVLGGTLALGADNVLSDETAVTVQGATLDMQGNSDRVASFQLVDGTLAGTGTLSAAEYRLEDAQVDANLGTGTLFQLGGTSELRGTSAADIVGIDAGTLRLGASERLADSASVQVAEGASFDLAGATETIAALYGMGSVDLGGGQLTLGGTGLDSGFGGTLTGSGTLSKTGDGVFTLLGDHDSWTGTLEVLGGTLQFVGSSGGGALIAGGMLSGNSTFASVLTMTGGTISPGLADAPIGTISAQTINLTGGTALFDFRSPEFGGLSDMLVASGAVTISGTEVVVSSDDPRSSFPAVQRYTIVQGGSLTGTFANGQDFQQMDDDPQLFWRLRYDLVENGVALEVRRTVDFAANFAEGSTPNQIAVATTLSDGQLEIGDAFSDAILPLGNWAEADQLRAFDSMGGESLTDATTGAFIEGQRFADLLTQRIYGKALMRTDGQAPVQARALAPVRTDEADALAAPDIPSLSMWVQGFGGATRVDGDAVTRNLRSDAAGFAGGIEARYGMFKAGIAGGYSQGSYDVRSLQASMQGETVHVGSYLGYEGEAAFAGLFGAYQKSDFDSTRQVLAANTSPLTATADIDMTGRTFGGFAGYRAPVGGGFVLTPMAGVTNIRIERDSFDEIGADPLNLLVSDETREVTYGAAQLRLSALTEVGGGTFEPFLAGGVERYWGDLSAVGEMRFAGAAGDMGSFRIIGAPLEKTVGVVGAGFDVRPSDRVEIGASAGARLSERVTQTTVEMHARIRF